MARPQTPSSTGKCPLRLRARDVAARPGFDGITYKFVVVRASREAQAHYLQGNYIRTSGDHSDYPPFSAQLILNGREWVRAQVPDGARGGQLLCLSRVVILPRSTVRRHDCTRSMPSVDCVSPLLPSATYLRDIGNQTQILPLQRAP